MKGRDSSLSTSDSVDRSVQSTKPKNYLSVKVVYRYVSTLRMPIDDACQATIVKEKKFGIVTVSFLEKLNTTPSISLIKGIELRKVIGVHRFREKDKIKFLKIKKKYEQRYPDLKITENAFMMIEELRGNSKTQH
jgi:hypothetical protein